MGAENTDDVDEAFRAITNAQYSVSQTKGSLRIYTRVRSFTFRSDR